LVKNYFGVGGEKYTPLQSIHLNIWRVGTENRAEIELSENFIHAIQARIYQLNAELKLILRMCTLKSIFNNPKS